MMAVKCNKIKNNSPINSTTTQNANKNHNEFQNYTKSTNNVSNDIRIYEILE